MADDLKIGIQLDAAEALRQTKAFNRSIKTTEEMVGKAEKMLDKLNTTVNGNSAATKKAAKGVEKGAASVDKLKNATSNIRTEKFKIISQYVSRMNLGLSGAAGRLLRMAGIIGSAKFMKFAVIAGLINLTTEAVAKLGAALFKLSVDSMAVFAKFDFELRKTFAITKATIAEQELLSSTVRKTAMETLKTNKEISEIVLNLSRAGMSAQEVAKTVGAATKFAIISGAGAGLAAKTMVKTMHAFQIEASRSEEVADKLSVTVNSTTTNLPKLGEAMMRVSGTAKQMNLSLDKTLSMLGTMSTVAEGRRAGTALRGMLHKQSEVIRKLGSDAKDLYELLEELQGSSVSTFVELFGRNFGSQAAFLSTKLDDIDALHKKVGASAGEIKKQTEIYMKSPEGALILFKNAIEDFKVSIGEELWVELGDSVRGVYYTFLEFKPALQSLVVNITKAAAAFAFAGKILFDVIKLGGTAVQAAHYRIAGRVGGKSGISAEEEAGGLTDRQLGARAERYGIFAGQRENYEIGPVTSTFMTSRRIKADAAEKAQQAADFRKRQEELTKILAERIKITEEAAKKIVDADTKLSNSMLAIADGFEVLSKSRDKFNKSSMVGYNKEIHGISKQITLVSDLKKKIEETAKVRGAKIEKSYGAILTDEDLAEKTAKLSKLEVGKSKELATAESYRKGLISQLEATTTAKGPKTLASEIKKIGDEAVEATKKIKEMTEAGDITAKEGAKLTTKVTTTKEDKIAAVRKRYDNKRKAREQATSHALLNITKTRFEAEEQIENDRWNNLSEAHKNELGAEKLHDANLKKIIDEQANFKLDIATDLKIRLLNINGDTLEAKLVAQQRAFDKEIAMYKKQGMDIEELEKAQAKDREKLKEDHNASMVKYVADVGKTNAEVQSANLAKERANITEHRELTSTEKEYYAAKEGEIEEAEMKSSIAASAAHFGNISDSLMMIANAQGKHAKKAFYLAKAAAIAQAVMNTATMALAGGASVAATPFIGAALAASWVPTAYAMGAIQIGAIMAQQPPSYDVGGVSEARGVYQTGNIREAHIPLKSGAIPVDLGKGSGGGGIAVTNNITVQSTGGDPEADRKQANTVARLVEQKVKQVLIQEKRHGGLLTT